MAAAWAWAELGFNSYGAYVKSNLWSIIRQLILERDGRCCQVCGTPSKIVHHIDYTRTIMLGQGDQHQLIILCESCHNFVEQDKNLIKKKNLLSELFAKNKTLTLDEWQIAAKKFNTDICYDSSRILEVKQYSCQKYQKKKSKKKSKKKRPPQFEFPPSRSHCFDPENTKRRIAWKELGFKAYNDYLKSNLWFRIRQLVLERDGKCCQVCDTPSKTVHHIDYTITIMSGEGDQHELIILCKSCHNFVEQSKNLLTKKNLLSELFAKKNTSTLDEWQMAAKQFNTHIYPELEVNQHKKNQELKNFVESIPSEITNGQKKFIEKNCLPIKECVTKEFITNKVRQYNRRSKKTIKKYLDGLYLVKHKRIIELLFVHPETNDKLRRCIRPYIIRIIDNETDIERTTRIEATPILELLKQEEFLKATLFPALIPTFGATTLKADGFTVQISNYDSFYTWAGTATASGKVSIYGRGLIVVTDVATGPWRAVTVTVTTTKANTVSGSSAVIVECGGRPCKPLASGMNKLLPLAPAPDPNKTLPLTPHLFDLPLVQTRWKRSKSCQGEDHPLTKFIKKINL